MQLDPPGFARDWPLVLAAIALVLFVNTSIAFFLSVGLGRSFGSAAIIAASLAQIGEFSFILGSLASGLGLLPGNAMNVIVAVSVATVALNPTIFKLVSDRARLRVGDSNGQMAEEGEDKQANRVVLVGYGSVGRVLYRILRGYGIYVTVIELNLETVKELRESGIAAVYGDATRFETMAAARLEDALSLIVSAPGLSGKDLTEIAKGIQPKIRVFLRSEFLGEVPAARDSGADEVFTDEKEVAISMASSLLRELGSTDEQIDLERGCRSARNRGGGVRQDAQAWGPPCLGLQPCDAPSRPGFSDPRRTQGRKRLFRGLQGTLAKGICALRPPILSSFLGILVWWR